MYISPFSFFFSFSIQMINYNIICAIISCFVVIRIIYDYHFHYHYVTFDFQFCFQFEIDSVCIFLVLFLLLVSHLPLLGFQYDQQRISPRLLSQMWFTYIRWSLCMILSIAQCHDGCYIFR